MINAPNLVRVLSNLENWISQFSMDELADSSKARDTMIEILFEILEAYKLDKTK